MADFQFYSPEDVIAVNLRESAERTCTVWEQEMAHLRELASHVTEESAPNAEFAHTLPEHRPPRFSELFRNLRADARFGQQLAQIRTTEQAVYLCLEICKQFRQHGAVAEEALLTEESEELAEHARDRIIYQRNSYADNAYLCFAELLKSPRALYAHSFSAICEEVYNGSAEFCILPLESSSEGMLNSFARLIDRYELKTVATCDVPATDAQRSTRFALLRRDLVPLPVPPHSKHRLFACSARLDASPSPAELLCAAQLCGLELYRLDSRVPIDGEDPHAHTLHYVFRLGQSDLSAFLLYLSMEVPHCTLDGFYFHIEQK